MPVRGYGYRAFLIHPVDPSPDRSSGFDGRRGRICWRIQPRLISDWCPRRARAARVPRGGAESKNQSVGRVSEPCREHFALGIRVARLLAVPRRCHGLGDDDI